MYLTLSMLKKTLMSFKEKRLIVIALLDQGGLELQSLIEIDNAIPVLRYTGETNQIKDKGCSTFKKV